MLAEEWLRQDPRSNAGGGRLKALAAKVAAVARRIKTLGMTRTADDLDAVAADLAALGEAREPRARAAYDQPPRP
jgi:hypothetical protein